MTRSDTWIDDQGCERGVCVICGMEASTHPHAAHPLEFCGDCNSVVCAHCECPCRSPRQRKNPSRLYLFSYGSNNPQQLADRLGRRIRGESAWLVDYRRVFRGWSQRWGGGVASLEKAPGSAVYGYITPVSEDSDLPILDGYEGVASGNYRRRRFTVNRLDAPPVRAVAYVSRSREFNEPSRAYLEAVAETIATFWTDERPVTWDTIPIR